MSLEVVVIKETINDSFLECVFDDIKDIIKANINDNPNNYPYTISFNAMINELKEKGINFSKDMLSESVLSTIVDEILKGVHN